MQQSAPAMQPQQPPGAEPTSRGAQALIADPRFGWGEQRAPERAMPMATGARLETGVGDASYRIRSNSRWVILAVFLIVTAGGAIAILVMH